MVISYHNVKFDDSTVTDDKHTWSQICEKCVHTNHFEHESLDDGGSGICGVEGCENEADYYIDFNDNEVKCLQNN